MDTTAPLKAVIFRFHPHSNMSSFPVSQVHCSMQHRHPAKGAISTCPPIPSVPCLTPIFTNCFSPENTPQPTFGTPGGHQQRPSLPNVCLLIVLPLMDPIVASILLGRDSAISSSRSARDNNATGTSPPSRGVIFQPLPVSKTTTSHFTWHFLVLGTYNPVTILPQLESPPVS